MPSPNIRPSLYRPRRVGSVVREKSGHTPGPRGQVLVRGVPDLRHRANHARLRSISLVRATLNPSIEKMQREPETAPVFFCSLHRNLPGYSDSRVAVPKATALKSTRPTGSRRPCTMPSWVYLPWNRSKSAHRRFAQSHPTAHQNVPKSAKMRRKTARSQQLTYIFLTR